jgi:hypothetical protein
VESAVKRKLHLAQMNIELCCHEVERLRAQHQLDAAEIRRLKRQVRQLEQKLTRRPRSAR